MSTACGTSQSRAMPGQGPRTLFQLAAVLGNLKGGGVNDAIVTRTSAPREVTISWPTGVDHAVEVGGGFGSLAPIGLGFPSIRAPAAHLARYDAIVDILR